VYRAIDAEGWEENLDATLDLVAIAGGDGAVGEVFRRLAGSSLPATLLPLGTANNIAATLGLSADLADLVAGWADGELCRYDLGTVTLPDGVERFVEGVGGGIMAEAIALAMSDDSASKTDDEIDFALRTLRRVLAQVKPRPWLVRLDGSEESHELVAAEALVIGRVGPRIPLAPAADVGDALLDVVLLGELELRELTDYVESRLAHASPPPPSLTARRAREVELVPPVGVDLRVDDEPVQSDGPLRASTGTLAVEILLPR
jgi:diacylglycerol kinase family enzyme